MPYDTLIPYDVLEFDGIQYTPCHDFSHISRYRGLRQIVHNPKSLSDRLLTLETPNEFKTNVDVMYHEVTPDEVNRLDLIAYRTLGSAQYSWVIAYFNSIEDGYTAVAGEILQVPENFTSLFKSGELLASVPPTSLNLGVE